MPPKKSLVSVGYPRQHRFLFDDVLALKSLFFGDEKPPRFVGLPDARSVGESAVNQNVVFTHYLKKIMVPVGKKQSFPDQRWYVKKKKNRGPLHGPML